MSCYHPLYAWIDHSIFENGKQKNKVTISKNQDQFKSFDDFKSMFDPNINPYLEPIMLPCGKCIGCKLDKSRDWANRCQLEASYYSENYFLTLTYDDDHLPYSQNYNALTKSYASVPTLRKKDLQDFLKRLRRHFEYNFDEYGIRFFACGEYGTINHRPHYHVILFNCKLSDDLVFKFSKSGNPFYQSPLIDKLWNKGIAIVSTVTWDTCAYTARYVLKKCSDSVIDPQWSDSDFEFEFINMSRRPGIGKNFYDDNKEEIYEFDRISKGFKSPIRPPKYYDRLYDVDNPEVMDIMKDIRKSKAEKSRFRPETDLSEKDYNSLREKNKIEQIKSLTREL